MTFPDSPQGPADTGVVDSTQQENAAPWASYLTDLPDSVRPLVEPIFKKWDADTTQRFQTVHSEYEPLKPYQQIVQNGWDFNDVQSALTLAATLNENPEAVYQALVESYGFGGEQGQSDYQDAGIDDQEYDDPRFARLEQMTEAMAQIMTQQQEFEQAQREDAELAQTLVALKEQFGEFDEQYVMTKVYSGATWEQAVGDFQNTISQYAQARPNVPVIMGSGGGLPSQVVNPGSMTDKDRKALITQMLAQANQT